MILKLIEPTNGEILFDHKPITEDVLNHFGYLPEEGSLLPQLSVLDICEYYGSLKLMEKEEIQKNLLTWLKEFQLENLFNVKIKKLSKGNRQKIQFIISVLHDPDFLILDEPFSGLDPVSVAELEKAILKLKQQGKTILFSSHIMEHVEKLSDDVLLIDHGNAILQGNLKECIENYTIQGKSVSSFNEIFIDKVGENHEA